MRKNALSDRILLSIDNPARYIGCEINSVMKDKAQVDIRYALCFPDVYEIGMSNLGIQIIYDQLNRREDVWCERVCSPWVDLHKILKSTNTPLFALESQDSVKDFDFVGMSLSYELCYVNILQILDLSGIPRYACDRKDNDPVVMAGGPCTYNPEPISDFFDLFYIGESETSMYALMDLYKEYKKSGFNRECFLREASHIPGIYVPSLYNVSYNEDGTIFKMTPLYPDVPEKVVKQAEISMSDTFYPESPVVPYVKAIQDRVTLEVMRGCIRGCRFCQAGIIYRPARERSLEFLKDKTLKMLKNTGYDEISLSSLSTSDYSELGELIDFLMDLNKNYKVNISLPSLRIDSFSLDVMSRVQNVKKTSLTFAPEAGSQRLRDIINKGITEEDILNGSMEAFHGGWNKVKLYFMLGLPFETEEDRKEIARLAERISEAYYDIPKNERNGKCQITVSTSFFVAKPFTPFQWAGMFTMEDYRSFADTVNSEIRAQKNRKSIRYNWHNTDATCLEGIFARGDRRLSRAIAYAYDHGALFEAWNDFFDYGIWEEAFKETGIDPFFYYLRKREDDEIFPWDIIDAGVSKDFLLSEWRSRRKEDLQEAAGQDAADAEPRYSEEVSVLKVRIRFSKEGNMKFVGHLDIMRYFQKALRRSGIRTAFSNGFSPHMIMSFAEPLGVSVLSNGEYFDLELDYDGPDMPSAAEMMRILNGTMAPGIRILDIRRIEDNKKSKAMSLVAAASYSIYGKDGNDGLIPVYELFGSDPESTDRLISSYMERECIPSVYRSKRGERSIDLKERIISLSQGKNGEICLFCLAGSASNLRPSLFIESFAEFSGRPYDEFEYQIIREDMFAKVTRMTHMYLWQNSELYFDGYADNHKDNN